MCRVENAMYKLSVVYYQVLLCLDTYDIDAIAINKLNLRYYTMNLVICQ